MHRRDRTYPLPLERELQTPRAHREDTIPPPFPRPPPRWTPMLIPAPLLFLAAEPPRASRGSRGRRQRDGEEAPASPLLSKLAASRAPPLHTGLPHVLSHPGAPRMGPQRDTHLVCSALRAARRSPSSWEAAWFWGNPLPSGNLKRI